MAALNTMIDCIADTAYKGACELVIGDMAHKMVTIQKEDIRQAVDKEVNTSTSFYNSMQRSAIRKVTDAVLGQFEHMKDRFTLIFESVFLGPGTQRENVGLIKNMIWESISNVGKPDRRMVNEINDIMNNRIVGWIQKTGATRRFNRYGIQKFWYRMESVNNDFEPISRQMEIPFDN